MVPNYPPISSSHRGSTVPFRARRQLYNLPVRTFKPHLARCPRTNRWMTTGITLSLRHFGFQMAILANCWTMIACTLTTIKSTAMGSTKTKTRCTEP